MSQAPERLQRGTSAEAIARHLRTEIESGTFRHEQQLPSTRALAAEWDTSVATITRAMQTLIGEGLVVSRDRSSRVVNYPGEQRQARSKQQAPTIVVIGGYAGSGKTELGRIIARLTGWPVFDKDSATRPVVEMALQELGSSPNDRESELYLTKVRPAEYEALRTLTAENVACGNSAIMTAPFIRELRDPSWTRTLEADAETLEATLRVVWIRCDDASMQTYLRRRGAARDTYKLGHWDDYVAGLDHAFTPAIAHDVIDNSLDSPPLREQAAQLLRSWDVAA
ncbi:GntR family transcriptional regulator [Actinomycetospora sp. CA-101289]|uniref:AAA family ATPase n=1 Tax=Actinomycetospora sp. CA-101289 TaxID=3239893 RepID=UPI003D952C11